MKTIPSFQDLSMASIQNTHESTSDIQEPQPMVSTLSEPSVQPKTLPIVRIPVLTPSQSFTSTLVASIPTVQGLPHSSILVPIGSGNSRDTRRHHHRRGTSSEQIWDVECTESSTPDDPTPSEASGETLGHQYTAELPQYVGRGRPGNPLPRPPVQAHLRPAFETGGPSGTQSTHYDNQPDFWTSGPSGTEGAPYEKTAETLFNDGFAQLEDSDEDRCGSPIMYASSEGDEYLFVDPAIVAHLEHLERYCEVLKRTVLELSREIKQLKEMQALSGRSNNIGSGTYARESSRNTYSDYGSVYDAGGRRGGNQAWDEQERVYRRYESDRSWAPEQIREHYPELEGGIRNPGGYYSGSDGYFARPLKRENAPPSCKGHRNY